MKVFLRTVMSNEGVWSHSNNSGAERQKLHTQWNEIIKIWSNNTDFQCQSTWCWQTILYTSKKPDNGAGQSQFAMLKWSERRNEDRQPCSTPAQSQILILSLCLHRGWKIWSEAQDQVTPYSPYSSVSATHYDSSVPSGV